jgi:elongation factor G
MKTYAPADLRNFAIVGHASAGKTMLAEAMLYCAGEIGRMGSIDQGTTVSDYHPGEQKRQLSMHSTPVHLEWRDRKFNAIDTPGYLDFISEGLGSLRVADFAVVVIHALHGIGSGTEQVWEAASRYGLPKIIVINGLDKEHVKFEPLLEQIRARFGAGVFPMQVPMNPGPGFNRVLDVLRSEVITYDAGARGPYHEVPADGEWAERVKALHQELVEHVAESDDTLMERFFEEGGLSEAVLREGIHPAIQNQVFVPLFCTAAESNIGVARLMDFIANFGSSPVDRQQVEAEGGDGEAVAVDLGSPESVGFVFATLTDTQGGDLSLLRVYAGDVHSGMDLYNSDRKTTERVGQLFLMNGRQRTPVSQLGPGDIGGVARLRDTHTGNTLCHPHRIIRLPKVKYPTPYTHASIKLHARGDEDKLAAGLVALHEEDPTFAYSTDSELHQTILSAQGELHLEVLIDRLRRRYRIELDTEKPRVRFRETIRGKGESKYRHKKQTGGAGQFAEVWMRIEPAPRDTGVEFTESLSGQNVDRVFVPSVEKGVRTVCAEGVVAGYPVVDVKIDFYDGKTHPVDSKDIAFQVAGYHAFKEAFLAAKPCMLEPVHEVTVRVPEDHLGLVMGDLSSRRGRIQGMESEGSTQVLRALVPAMELHRYSSVLRSLTGGKSHHEEVFSHYEEMPREMEQKIIEESKQAKEAEH